VDDLHLVDDLHEAVQQCAADAAVRALLIGANGPAFTVGGTSRCSPGPGLVSCQLRCAG
jgi:enoyl-CoA hydratase/carnithine racemase